MAASRLPGETQGERPHEVECVYIPDTDRGTLCVSSQVGCTLTCSFCHTGTQRLVRNLTADEIVGQVMVARDRLGDWPGATRPTDGVMPTGDRCITNIVMMGMGEPLYNLDAVRDALLIVADGDGIGISKRRITLSTSGVVPNIERAGAEIGCMLAVSLHAVRDDLRNELVPLNRKYPIAQLLEACRNYPGVSNAKRITFEYVMLKGVNDFIDDAKALVRLLEGHSGQDQSHPVQSLAGQQLRMFRLGADREIFAGRVRRRLCLAGAHAARARHFGRLRPAQERDRKAVGARAHGAARHGDDGLALWHLLGRIDRHHSSPCSWRRWPPALPRPSRCSASNCTMVGTDPVEHVFFWGTAIFASGVTVFVGFLPILIAVVLAEAFAIRSLLIQAAAGAAILLLGYYSAGFACDLRGIDRSSAAADLARRPRSRPRSGWCSASPIG